MEPGRVRALREAFERNTSASAKPITPAEFENKRKEHGAGQASGQLRIAARVASRHNLKFAQRRASHANSLSTGKARASTTTSAVSLVEFDEDHHWVPFTLVVSATIDEEADESTNADGAFWFSSDLAESLEREDERGVNKAILRFFFQEHDPGRMEEVERLLDENAGREEAFFAELSTEYPDSSASSLTPTGAGSGSGAHADAGWATFVDEDIPIVTAVRRRSGAWAVNSYDPWGEQKQRESAQQ